MIVSTDNTTEKLNQPMQKTSSQTTEENGIQAHRIYFFHLKYESGLRVRIELMPSILPVQTLSQLNREEGWFVHIYKLYNVPIH